MRQFGIDRASGVWRIRGCLSLMPLALAVFAMSGSTSWGEEPRRPNIVVILSDDMGWSDLGCYGGEIDTPRLDALADGGLRFTQFYNTGRCCPTRASLLTGLYPHQAGVGHMLAETGHAGYTSGLNDHCVTIAQVLRPSGYRSYAVGKWHVTRHVGAEGPKENWPLQRGFDRYYGTITGGGNYFDPTSLTRGNERISPTNDPEYRPDTYYYTNAISDNAVRFIEDHQTTHAEEPFFLYVAYTAAHWPMHALPEDIERFRGRYGKGYDAVRRDRLARQRALGLVDPNWELSPQPISEPDEGLSEWEQRCMEVYAAMVYRMDAGIGKIVDSLKASEQLDNTLILFLQDNGGCAEEVGRGPESNFPNTERAMAPTLPPLDPTGVIDLGVHYRQTRDGYPARRGNRVMPGAADTFVAYGEAWANVSNTPFRLYKHYVHEGGISTPLVAHWPAGIQRAGELETQPGHLIDVMATCVDLAGADYPAAREGKAIYPMEGRSLMPAFQGEEIARDALYWEHESNRAIRVGDWKLAAVGPKGAWELYDMQADRTEMHDLAGERPEKARELAEKWEAWAKRAHVLPIEGWKDRPGRRRASFSKKKRFQLNGDAALERGKSPDVAGRGFTVEVTLEKLGKSGVIVAQGGSARGWALYQRISTVQEKDSGATTGLEFAVRSPKGLEVARVEEVPPGTKRVGVRLEADGTVVFRLDGVEAGKGKVAWLVDSMPVDGLQVGRDENGLVGDYFERNAYDGTIERVVIELE